MSSRCNGSRQWGLPDPARGPAQFSRRKVSGVRSPGKGRYVLSPCIIEDDRVMVVVQNRGGTSPEKVGIIAAAVSGMKCDR